MRKKIMGAILVAIALIVMAMGGSFCQAGSIHEEAPARLVDTTKTLTVEEKAKINDQLDALHNAGKAEMVVVMVPDLEGKTVEEFSMDIAERWKVGKKGEDNGLLLVIAKDEHKMRLEVGRGLEGNITDGMAGEIIDRMKPQLRNNDFAGAILSATADIELKIDGKEIEHSAVSNWTETAKVILCVIACIYVIWFFFAWLYEAHAAKYRYGFINKSYAYRFFSVTVFLWAVESVIESTVDIFITLPLECLSGGSSGSSGGSSSFDLGGSFDGGGASGDW